MRTLILLLLFYSCTNRDGGGKSELARVKVGKELHSILKEGDFEVDYFANKQLTDYENEVLLKLGKFFDGDHPEAESFLKELDADPKLQYRSGIGLSRKEFDTLKAFFGPRTPIKKTGKLRIAREGNNLTFQGTDQLGLLDSLIIIDGGGLVTLGETRLLHYEDSIDLSQEYIPDGEIISDYEFYVGPQGFLSGTAIMGTYELLIGKLNPSQKTYISLYVMPPSNKNKHGLPMFVHLVY